VCQPTNRSQLNATDAENSDDPGNIFSDDQEQACTPSGQYFLCAFPFLLIMHSSWPWQIPLSHP
jgi:hypothetical protein